MYGTNYIILLLYIKEIRTTHTHTHTHDRKQSPMPETGLRRMSSVQSQMVRYGSNPQLCYWHIFPKMDKSLFLLSCKFHTKLLVAYLSLHNVLLSKYCYSDEVSW